MISRTVRIQLLALALVAIIGIGYTGFRYAGLDRVFGATTYPVTVQLADSGGIFTGADVTYRGVSVGRVGPLTLTDAGVDVQLDIDNSAPSIPSDTAAEIRNLSAIGEQYVDLQPGPEGGPTLAAGSVVPVNRTTTPVGVEDLVVNLDNFVKTVPLDSLRTVVDEAGQGFANTAQPLQQLLDTTGQFTQAGIDALPQTTALIRDARPVLTTQNETAPQFKEFAASLKLVTQQLKDSDPDLRRIIQNAPEAGDQISGLLRESGPGLGESIANLREVSEVLEPRQAALKQILVTYPGLVAIAPKVLPGDGTAHLGLALNINNPPVCTRGYEGTTRRSAQDVSEVPVNSGAFCGEPPGSVTSVRGMQNVPRAETPMPSEDAGDTPAPPPAAGPDPVAGGPILSPALVTDFAQILGGS
ncbi:phospholipid/cholesterol/gamma-HCH transport system substrate-binding protein [Pseudonocardia sediminis]|uniref:Phospholipid/cholesterol/gamma-HCH transport system substrate-binding protein n=1 Tax=Pseudonocardia sediminis TaxID=1397368 RepID=A0A4Q7V6J9_PSEST|nr:MlaD family protein [Pseudonocardia sediminis]RZT88403.1 phospholipid/cholesterol/gamma-HCH transport system substrate-binding protein [Pseudonocardia sediminis]